jgi:hypothetical protein
MIDWLVVAAVPVALCIDAALAWLDRVGWIEGLRERLQLRSDLLAAERAVATEREAQNRAAFALACKVSAAMGSVDHHELVEQKHPDLYRLASGASVREAERSTAASVA